LTFVKHLFYTEYVLRILLRSKLTYVLLVFYLLIFIWWVKIFISGVKISDENYLFGLVYAFIALIGGVNGLLISKKWGGYKSLVGKGIIFLSFGLLSYWFGQVAWSYYNLVLKVELPYPSIADIGYFAAILFYIAGMYTFARVSGAKLILNKLKGKLISFIIPASMLAISYFLFLQHISPDFSNIIKTFLDFGTPVGYTIVISMALTAYFLTRGVLGGKMKNRVLYIILALIVQNITDNTFLYQAGAGIYYNAGINDFMFATSFTVMSIALIMFKNYD